VLVIPRHDPDRVDVVPEQVDIPNYYAMPNLTGGTFFVGGPSNAGGLFLKLGDPAARRTARSRSIPRVCRCGCRTAGRAGAAAGSDRRGQLVDLDLTQRRRGAAASRRLEATAFATRRMIDAAAGHAGAASSRRRRRGSTGGRGAGPTALVCRCTCARFPKAVRSGPHSFARIACGLERR